MTLSDDVPLEAPSLLQLSASAVAKAPSLLVEWAPSSSSSSVSAQLLGDIKPRLPRPASEAAFTSFVAEWRSGRVRNASVVNETMAEFCEADRLPLESINVADTNITVQKLCKLLNGQAQNVSELNTINCKHLGGIDNLAALTSLAVMPKLRTLKLSNAELFEPWLLTPGGQRHRCPPDSAPMITFEVDEDLEEIAVDQLDGEMPDILVGEDGLLAGSSPIHEEDEEYNAMEDRLAETPLIDRTPPSPTMSLDDTENSSEDDVAERACSSSTGSINRLLTGRCPSLREFTFFGQSFLIDMDVDDRAAPDFLSDVLSPVPQLTVLDLSYWSGLCDMHFIRPMSQSLRELVLYNVPDLYQAVSTICEMTLLIKLDVSQSSRDTGTYPKPVTTLYRIVMALPNLSHLDISTTNLASQPSKEDWPAKEPLKVKSDVAGLYGLRRRLDFLGLFGCDTASHYAQIPATEVTGDANEEQMVAALRAYGDRAQLLQAVLNETYNLYRFGSNQKRYSEALHLVLVAMQKHVSDVTLQIAGSASLFYILKNVSMNRVTKRNVVIALITGMEVHIDEQVMIRNCCLSLCQFEIPQEMLFDYGRVATLLVRVLEKHGNDGLTQKIVVFMLNSMACHVEGDQKVQVGQIGAIEIILNQIAKRHEINKCDDVMEVSWSFLWNITDETPVNCERFLNGQGLKLFQNCYTLFPTKRKLQRNMMGLMKFGGKTELIRNMMGLMGNLAEVKALRSHLMDESLLTIFCSLLENLSDGIEISYNSAGVLAHLCSDGKDAWAHTVNVDRNAIQMRIVTATDSWQLNARRFINYRSFKPILSLLTAFDSPGSQHWATWALANLTTTDGRKYCPFVVNEGGVPLLRTLVTRADEDGSDVLQKTRTLAQAVLDNVDKWTKNELPLPSEELIDADDLEA